MLDRFTSIEVFRALVRHGTFTAAADELGLSRAMASKHIQALEQHLGVRLFNRTTRSTRLTEAGQRYYEGIDPIVAALDQVETRLLDETAQVRGLLTVAAPPAFGAFHLAPVVAGFMREHPDLRVRLYLTDRAPDLVDEGIDIAISVRELEHSNYIARHLADVAMIVCAAPAYVRQHGAPSRPQDLDAHNCLIYGDGGAPMRSAWQFRQDGKVLDVAVSGNFCANVGAALRQLAVAGHGIARLPGYLVRDDINHGRLEMLLEAFAPALRPVHALYPHREYVPAKVRQFIDFALAQFG